MTVIVAAICLTLVLGAGALAVDLGVARNSRRNLVSATDAAALAAGRALAGGEGNWSSQCAGVLHDNAPDAVLGSCALSGSTTSRTGAIEVTATEPVDYVLAPVFDDAAADSGGVVASASVHVGIPSVVRGLRPLALCVNEMFNNNNGGQLKNALEPLLGGGPAAQVELNLRWDDGQVDDCRRQGNPDGPWTFLDFEPGPGNVDARVAEWAEDGYDGALGAASGRDLPEFFATAPRSGQTPAELSALDATLSGLAGEQVLVALYDEAHPYQADVAYATTVRVVAFVRAEFVNVQLSGSGQDRIRVRLYPWSVVEGTCCGVAGGLFDSPAVDLPSTGTIEPPRLRTLRICSVDHAVGNCG